MTFSADIGSNRDLILNQLRYSSGNFNGIAIYADTLGNETKSLSLPNQYRFGFNMDHNNKWNFVADYTYSNYGNFKTFDATNFYDAGHRISGGIEIVPKFNDRNYLKRITYRLGGYYLRSPLNLPNTYNSSYTRPNEWGISWGFGLPIKKVINDGTGGNLNIAFTYGKRGTLENGMVQENFFRFYVGITIFDRWFIRYKEE